MTGATWSAIPASRLTRNKGSPVNRAQQARSPRLALCSCANSAWWTTAVGKSPATALFTLATSALNNQEGRLLSGGALTLRIAQALDNSLEGIVSGAGGLDIQAFRPGQP
ncbi:hypothetical protein P4126_33775 [Pseudomonas aeruginosa]|nr:hypothetical protein [Pseudomonas aeruginosa]